MRRRSMLPAAIAAAALALLTGCESAPKATSLDQALDSYEAGHYAAAHDGATAAFDRSTGRDRDEAAYLAGLSAYRLGNLSEAERRLMTARSSSDATIAANAEATLGLIRMDQDRPHEAARHFTAAASGLTGRDAREAARHAAEAYREVGDFESARTWTAMASRPVSDEATGRNWSDPTGGFALQVGAFSDETRARRAADDAASVARANRCGDPRIVPITDSRGRYLHVVQFGTFPTRSAADRARRRIGRLEYIVAPTAIASR